MMRKKIIAIVTALSLAGMCSLYIKPRNSGEKILSQPLEKKVCQNTLYVPKGTDIRDINFAIRPDCIRYTPEERIYQDFETKEEDNFDSKKYTPTQKNYSKQEIRKIVIKKSIYYNIEPELGLALAMVESDLIPDAVSQKGALGVMQLMLQTARHYKPNVTRHELLNDPELNIEIGTTHLRDLLKKYSYREAIAAYNAGEPALVDGKYKYNGETSNFINKVMEKYIELRRSGI